MRHALAFVSYLAAAPLSAEDARSAAEAYAGLPVVQRQIDDMFAPAMVAQFFRAGVPADVEISPDKMARIGAILSVAMMEKKPEVMEVMVTQMSALFTVEEIEALTEFYQSDAGASAMSKMQPYMQGVMGAMAQVMVPVQQAVLPDIVRILEE
ncbi:DUF2059 domain-containing protein [Maritimibacter sp. DP1N21-5]|uniref:DUF2059 domain-containing protein n=1 Tax=Maritimibacter sp. DP1N21-5 TaxID=2836867 RepID=UPI001C45B5DC|nr:DUF2059 domain-containing protein [Maritimibacter sp. DP1N21-5]MBV7407969.1 DUF2059 domain-containing protein [Maritimibacter sp. DP1N21-5]